MIYPVAQAFWGSLQPVAKTVFVRQYENPFTIYGPLLHSNCPRTQTLSTTCHSTCYRVAIKTPAKNPSQRGQPYDSALRDHIAQVWGLYNDQIISAFGLTESNLAPAKLLCRRQQQR